MMTLKVIKEKKYRHELKRKEERKLKRKITPEEWDRRKMAIQARIFKKKNKKQCKLKEQNTQDLSPKRKKGLWDRFRAFLRALGAIIGATRAL